MKKTLLSILTALPLTVGAQNYAQLSSAVDQRVLPDQQPTVVVLDTIDAVDGIAVINGGTTIELGADGLYFQIWAPQVDREKGAKDEWLDLWTSTNGVDDPNSNVRLDFGSGNNGSTTVIPAQSVGCFNAGDLIQVLMSGSSENVGLVVIEPDGEPRIPAIIGTIYRVGDC